MADSETKIFYHPLSLAHDTGLGHPERPDRIQAVLNHLKDVGLSEQCDWKKPELALLQSIYENHGKDYVSRIEEVAASGGGDLDGDTIMSAESYEAALASAGACIQAVDIVLSGEARNAFSLNRPPGHHARPSTAMGFCLFNNIAIGAYHALRRHDLERVFIFDWDVHHGNGTQESFYRESSVFFCSIHQSPLYPGTGMRHEIGEGLGEGYTLNLPVSAGSIGEDYKALFREKVSVAIREFRPELIMISAGFDAHWRDPLAGVHLKDEDFGSLTREVMDLADELCDGRIVSVLEGGYDLEGLAGGVEYHLKALLDSDVDV